jgi:hypothetical protein
MLPMTIGVVEEDDGDDDELDNEIDIPGAPFDDIRRSPTRRRPMIPDDVYGRTRLDESRVLSNLRNNPTLMALFENEELVEKMSKPTVLTADQRGGSDSGRGRTYTTYRRAAGVKTHIDNGARVKQTIEQRPIPPLVFTPKGRHTRIRLTGATENELPGVGGRFILPSLDPVMPAFNGAVSTQGKQRDEYDSMIKLPNDLMAGDSIGAKIKTKKQKFVGGNGAFGLPVAGMDTVAGR